MRLRQLQQAFRPLHPVSCQDLRWPKNVARPLLRQRQRVQELHFPSHNSLHLARVQLPHLELPLVLRNQQPQLQLPQGHLPRPPLLVHRPKLKPHLHNNHSSRRSKDQNQWVEAV